MIPGSSPLIRLDHDHRWQTGPENCPMTWRPKASRTPARRVWRFGRGCCGEWFAHSRLILGVVLLWLVAVWFLPIFAHPSWILALGGCLGWWRTRVWGVM